MLSSSGFAEASRGTYALTRVIHGSKPTTKPAEKRTSSFISFFSIQRGKIHLYHSFMSFPGDVSTWPRLE